eukprot:351557-Chlamydomonas_euryale.AAC.14
MPADCFLQPPELETWPILRLATSSDTGPSWQIGCRPYFQDTKHATSPARHVDAMIQDSPFRGASV